MFSVGGLVYFKGSKSEIACFGVITRMEEDGLLVTWSVPDSSGDTEDWFGLDEDGSPHFDNENIVFIKDKQ